MGVILFLFVTLIMTVKTRLELSIGFSRVWFGTQLKAMTPSPNPGIYSLPLIQSGGAGVGVKRLSLVQAQCRQIKQL